MTQKAQRDLIDINKDDLYELLGVPHDAPTKAIQKSYKKKALKYHPDKNPDPAAHKVFLKLTQILELLTNEQSRAHYDTIIKARAAAKIRTQHLDAKRRKLKEDLEHREKGGVRAAQYAETQLKEMIKKLQSEGESLLKREEEKMRKEFTHKTECIINDKATVKIKWKCKKDDKKNGGYSEKTLRSVLSKYGPVGDIIVNSKRGGSALAVFDSIAAAKICIQKEKGLENMPLTFRIVHDTDQSDATNVPDKPSACSYVPSDSIPRPADINTSGQFGSFPTSVNSMFSSAPGPPLDCGVDRDYESLTLMRLRQAEERKRLIEEMTQNDNEEETGFL